MGLKTLPVVSVYQGEKKRCKRQEHCSIAMVEKMSLSEEEGIASYVEAENLW